MQPQFDVGWRLLSTQKRSQRAEQEVSGKRTFNAAVQTRVALHASLCKRLLEFPNIAIA